MWVTVKQTDVIIPADKVVGLIPETVILELAPVVASLFGIGTSVPLEKVTGVVAGCTSIVALKSTLSPLQIVTEAGVMVMDG